MEIVGVVVVAMDLGSMAIVVAEIEESWCRRKCKGDT